MIKKHVILFLAVLLSVNFSIGQKPADPPSWAKNVIWYQLFVERFNNGDKSNDPTDENTTVANMNIIPPKGWKISPWTSNWYERQPWEQNPKQDFNTILQFRRYGGDLQGVLDKLDYLQDLGITAIYLNPINDAPSLHKYDARNYHHVDVNFGPDPVGDNKIIASENPIDPATWKWTSADKLFLKLVDQAHKRGMRIIMDYSWNHTGTDFWAWKDLLKNQANSKYKDWYEITSFDNPNTPENEFKYKGWANNDYLPEFKKVDIKTKRVSGLPYEGNINEGAKQHIFDVTKRWLAPDGDLSKGIDGYRLDVADQIGLGFWRDYRTYVKSVNPDAYLVGEIWWQQWPNKLMDPAPYMQGDMFDAVMYYQVYKPARSFFVNTDDKIDAGQFRDSLELQWNAVPEKMVYSMMNVSSSHDTPRLLTDFYNTNAYKYHANPAENPQYKTGKPDKETYKRLRMYLVHLFTTKGAPQIWNGEEMGMWGSDDPNCRKPLMWPEMKFDKEYRNNFQPGEKQYDKIEFNKEHFAFYKKLAGIRRSNPVLSEGNLQFIVSEGKKFGYSRSNGKDKITVLFNMESNNQTFELTESGSYVDLLTGRKINGKTVVLKPLTAVVLK